ncbi:MAG TPA: regulatory signaling modulator protein AmpE [Steroidobacteraceae bacterium]|nr:regulatory signaling modulator protein AmpE [Steroidobacteraceae bacterium]
MTLLALLLGLMLERAATELLHLREPRWFDGYLEWALRYFRGLRGGSVIVMTVVLVLLPVLPVALVAWVFREVLLGILFVGFGALVLVFSLGPRDLKTEVDEYLDAIGSGDRETAARVAREITEHDAAQRTVGAPSTLADAIFVQANNRAFGVLFWFMALGPAGAWAFRVSDLMRRRAVFEYRGRADSSGEVPEFVNALQVIHGVLAWAPARLLALGYALAGNFGRATGAWKDTMRRAVPFFDANDELLGSVGRAAVDEDEDAELQPLPEARDIRACMSVVNRALLIWLVFVAALVLIGWVR